MKLLTLVLLVFSLTSLAHKKDHREHGSHVHGHASLSIAFDNLNGQLEFKGAGQGLLGFEHQAKSPKDKQKLAEFSQSFESQVATFVQFDNSAGCVMTKTSIDLVNNKGRGSHSDFVAKFSVTCAKSVQGTSLVLDFSALDKLTEVGVTVLVGELQLKSEVKTKKLTMELK